MRYIPAILLLTYMLVSCKQETCTVSCSGGTVTFYAVGYTKQELAGAVGTYYGSGSTITRTLTVTDISHPTADTTSDTLSCGAMSLVNGTTFEKVELYIPSLGITRTLSDFGFSGPLSEQRACHNGGHIAGVAEGVPCSGPPKLTSYKVDGVAMSGSTAYIHK